MRGTKPFSTVTLDTSSTNIPATYIELVASLGKDCSSIVVCASAAIQIIIGYGGASAETDFIALAVSTVQSRQIPIEIPKGARLSVKSFTGTISSGILAITFFN